MKRGWTAITIMTALIGICFADSIEIIPIKSQRAGPLFKINRAGNWGFIDRHR